MLVIHSGTSQSPKCLRPAAPRFFVLPIPICPVGGLQARYQAIHRMGFITLVTPQHAGTQASTSLMSTTDARDRVDEATPLLLTLTGASVDAMIILGLNVLTAAQTGNTVLLAVAIARGDAVTGPNALASVAAFAVGCFLGAFSIQRWEHVEKRGGGILPVLVVEMALLTILLLLWRIEEPVTGVQTFGIVALAAFTMGVQSAAMLHVHGPGTTYMTGMLATFSTGLVGWLSADWRSARHEAGIPDAAQAKARFPWRNGAGWLVYLAGAIVCGSLYLRFGALAMLMPIGISALTVALLGRRRI